jgi:acyl-CoA thioesterase-1
MHKSGKQWGTLALLGLFIFHGLCAQTAWAARRDPSAMKRILVLGDSLSEGFSLKSTEAWPVLIVEKLRSAGFINFEVTNASQSGGTTDGGLARLPPHLKRRVDIFVLELGINDAFRGLPVPQIEQNLQEIIDRVRAKYPAVQIVIAGLQLPAHNEDDYIRDFGRMYVDLAAKNHAAIVLYLLKGVAGNPLLNLGDRIHPNAAGHKILAQNVWEILEPIAREAAQSRNAAAP